MGTTGIDDTAAELALVWRDVFGAEPGPDDELTDLGAQSVKLIDVILRVQERLGVSLPLEVFLAPTTLRRLAAEIAAVEGTRA